MQAATATNDIEVLDRLNSGYIRSVQRSDVYWFSENLAQDFLNRTPIPLG